MARSLVESGVKWIGRVPADWKHQFAIQLFDRVKNVNSDLEEKNLLSLSYGKIVRKNIETTEGLLPESFDGYNIIESGDIVLRLTDLQNDHKSLRVGLATERGIVTSAYLTLRPDEGCCPDFFYYYLHSYDICKGFYGMGAGVRQGLNWDGLKHLEFYIPEQTEQERIARFLNAKCASIDSIIEKTRTSIEEYKKLRQAVITQAVTKGVRSDRPMKDTVIKRMSQCPCDWDVIKLKYVTYIRARLGWKGLTADEYVDDGYVFIGTPNIDENGYIDWENVYYITEERYVESPEIMLSEGDILLTKDGAGIGKCAYIENLPREAAPNGSLAVITCGERLSGKFLYYYFKSYYFQKYIDELKAGMGVPHLFQSDLNNIYIPVPGIDEQIDIVRYLDEKCPKIERLIEKKTVYLDSLLDLKKSLIYECVTGKREVS